jgi:hypothetical protein
MDTCVRRHLLRQFSYGVYYSVEGDEIVIWAIQHTRQQDSWRKRRGV